MTSKGTPAARRAGRQHLSPEQRLLLGAAPDAIVVVDQGGRIVEVNAQVLELFGYSEGELIDRPVEVLVPRRLHTAHRRHRERYGGAPKTCVMGAGLELLGRRRDHSEFPIEVRLSPMPGGDDVRYIAIVRDVSERNEVRDRLETSLRAQEALLKEMHHRVRNNMQVISSLLRLQHDTIADAGARAALAESLSRVQAITLTHEILRLSNFDAEVDLAAYGVQLVSQISRIYGVAAGAVRFDVSIAPLCVPYGTAVKIGLILNELVTNCLKHAFAPGAASAIMIDLRSSEDGGLELTVADNGIGLPSHIDRRHFGSLGLQIVENLVTQLAADMSIARERGTRVTIRVPAAT